MTGLISNSSFEAYYQELYGDRWKSLRKNLLEKRTPIAFTQGIRLPYMLDRGSVLAAQSLRLPDTGLILDACAAPGGKSLVIAASMGPEVSLLANEPSRERRRRLLKVLEDHLNTETRRRVQVSGFDAAQLGGNHRERSRFAGVLLDAPCSSERYVLMDPNALGQWTPARPRFLARRQWALLSAAFLLLRPGASLVYVTCALSEEENDGVASRLLAKYGPEVLLDEPSFPEGEKTPLGRLILPDTSDGIGPLYIARFTRSHAM
ncbi:MAG: 16S rRNA methyltransferase [Spirochaetaceae bacterium]|jgi:16S rRNA (cytosine1407-C5)-methyltransferase|nr:16S rRNA methyltransferase [Spirochaetaceae bacterium]